MTHDPLSAIRARHRLTVGQYQLSPAELDRGELLDEVDRLQARLAAVEAERDDLARRIREVDYAEVEEMWVALKASEAREEVLKAEVGRQMIFNAGAVAEGGKLLARVKELEAELSDIIGLPFPDQRPSR